MLAHALTLPGRLRAAAMAMAPAPTVTFVDRREREVRRSYASLYAGALRCAHALRAAGVQDRDRVAIMLPTGPDFYHALFGAMVAGAIAVPMYPPTRLGNIDEALGRAEDMLRSVGACCLLSTDVLGQLMATTVARAGARLGVLPAMAGTPSETVAEAEALYAPQPTGAALIASAEGKSDALALLQFSSGTTAAPKAIALTHRQIGANVDVIVASINAHAPPAGRAKHCTVSWLPLYHDMGLMGCVFGALVDQSELVLLPPEAFVGAPALWLRAISRHRASVSAAPNFAYAYCAERIGDEAMVGLDLSCWQVALNGAEGVSQASMRAFADRFAACGMRAEAFGPVYGLAEATLAVTFDLGGGLLPDRLQHGAVCVGRPLPTMQVRIDASAQATGAGASSDPPASPRHQVGRVQVQGPSVCEGYWRGGRVVPARGADGWLTTGDIGFLHGGALHIVGRQSDLLIVRGRNLSPEPIERAAQAAVGVRRGCVVAAGIRCADASTDTVVVLAETRVQGAQKRAALRAAIAAHVADAVGITLGEVALVAPGTLLRTSSGKLRRRASLDAYRANTLRAPQRFGAWRLAWRLLRQRVWPPSRTAASP